MSTSLPYVDEHHVPRHKMAFDDIPEMRNDPPPTYDNNNYDFGVEEYAALANSSPLSQSTQNLVDALGSILDASFEKEQFIESLETALRQQPAAKHKQIFDIAQSILHACRNVYKPKEDSSTTNHEEQHQKNLDASQSESETEDIAAKFHAQRHQSISAKDQLELQESAQALKLSKASSSKTVPRSKATSSNIEMTRDMTSRESSRLSSPETVATPPRIEDALEKEAPRDPKEAGYALRSLISQSIEEFIYHSHQQIIEFSSWSEESIPPYMALARSLYGEERKGDSTGPSGSEWLILAESGQADRKLGAMICALAAIKLQKWHASQILEHNNLSLQSASKLVTDRLVGPKPADHYKKTAWIQRRSNIATLLTRGKKWNQLVEHLGLGILFKDTWKLAKIRNIDLPFLIEELENDQAKMEVLKILSKQLTYLIKDGITKQKVFEDELCDASQRVNFALPTDFIPSTEFIELDKLYQEISKSVTSGRLTIRNSRPPCDFKVTALQRLKGQTWLNDKLLVACLHLYDKLPFVRIGWSITIHQDIRPNTPMKRPFERASQKIQAWKKEANSQLVYFFPLYQHGNHFTLLEINEKEGYVYHYDSMSGDSTEVKNACEQQFSHLPFREKEAMQQKDGDSCGFMVIKHAQNRMLGLPVKCDDGASIDSTSLRCEVINLLKAAWNQGALVEAHNGSKRKRGAEIEDVDLGRTRRKRSVKALKD